MPLEENVPSDSNVIYSNTELALMEQGYEFVSLFQAKTPDMLFSVALLISHQLSVAERVSFHVEHHGSYIRILARHEQPSILPAKANEVNPDTFGSHPNAVSRAPSSPPPLPAPVIEKEFDGSERPTSVEIPPSRFTEPGRINSGTRGEIDSPPDSGAAVSDTELIHS